MSDEEEEEGSSSPLPAQELTELATKQRKHKLRNEFIDDEADLSGDDEVSEDEDELSDDDQLDPELVDQDAPELDSDQEEEVRGMYFKQIQNEDKRAVLLMKEQLEDKNVSIGQQRRKKFRWQTAEIMETSLRRHYDPDDDDSHDEDEDPLDEQDFEEVAPRLRRPTAESFLLNSATLSNLRPGTSRSMRHPDLAGPVSGDDSNSNTISSASRLTGGGHKVISSSSSSHNGKSMDMNRFVFRDRETVEALSTREIIITTREEKDKAIERELKRVLQSKSIFDQLYT